jgi:hypothetical protein
MIPVGPSAQPGIWMAEARKWNVAFDRMLDGQENRALVDRQRNSMAER